MAGSERGQAGVPSLLAFLKQIAVPLLLVSIALTDRI